jgi:vibriolysin
MFKKYLFISIFLFNSSVFAINQINLNHASLKELSHFVILPKTTAIFKQSNQINALKPIGKFKIGDEIITRYQQVYKGIPVFGAQLTIGNHLHNNQLTGADVNGHLLDDIKLNIVPKLNSLQVLGNLAKSSDISALTQTSKKIELQIRQNYQQELRLVYLVSFKEISLNNKPKWLFFVVDAHSGKTLNKWNNIQALSDTGPGGNEKVHEYWYGQDGLPFLQVTEQNENCLLADEHVKIVDLHSTWEWTNEDKTPIQYLCHHNVEDYTNGAYSPGNDAYFFGHTIIDFFQDWYHVYPLQDENAAPKQLIFQIHFGNYYDNAFWDGETLTFGDGYFFYPLISLDITTHEVAHGFTQHHSNLEYHDESGALNESFSDMAAETALAYLLEINPNLYNKMNVTQNKLAWKMGETVIRPQFKNKIDAIRYFEKPSYDESSADCYDKKLARSQRSYCAISYSDVLLNAQAIKDEDEQQSYIVHAASGIFNRAFYLLSQEIGIKKAFNIMLLANTKYWTPESNFQHAACGVLHATQDLNESVGISQAIFKRVGLDTSLCFI